MNITQAACQNDKNALGVTYETAVLVGDRLRQARERKKLSPNQVSARTKIRDRYIEAIEIGDWDVLPPGLNGRGLIRIYAREFGVSIPEFECFHHLQTVRLEKQSENLMTSSSRRRSKYHPAAEESAEVIRCISRNDFQKNLHLDPSEYTVAATGAEDSNNVAGNPSQNSKVYARPVFTQRAASSSSASIVTPNIYDVLGLELEENKMEHSPSHEYEITDIPPSNQRLPTAEPVKKGFTGMAHSSVAHVHSPTHQGIETGDHYKKEFSILSAKEILEKINIKKRLVDLSPLPVIVVLGLMMVFVFVGLFLFSRNSNPIKVTNLSAKQIESDIGSSEPLPNSIISSNIPNSKEGQKSAEYPPQTQTVATDGKAVASTSSEQKVSHVLEVERVAKLNIASKVNISIEADGQQIFSGVHASGALDVLFKNKAEIVISDASKVSLIYEGINHGPLGYAGRKRKILLNAKPYIE